MNNFFKSMVGRYFVVQTYSHTDRRQLWKVLSRGITSLATAETTRQVVSLNKPKKNAETFIVKIVDGDDNEMNINALLERRWHEGYKAAMRKIREDHPDWFLD